MTGLIRKYRGYEGVWTREGDKMKGVFFIESEKLCVGGCSVFEDSDSWRESTNRAMKDAIDLDIAKHKDTRFVGFASTPIRVSRG